MTDRDTIISRQVDELVALERVLHLVRAQPLPLDVIADSEEFALRVLPEAPFAGVSAHARAAVEQARARVRVLVEELTAVKLHYTRLEKEASSDRALAKRSLLVLSQEAQSAKDELARRTHEVGKYRQQCEEGVRAVEAFKEEIAELTRAAAATAEAHRQETAELQDQQAQLRARLELQSKLLGKIHRHHPITASGLLAELAQTVASSAGQTTSASASASSTSSSTEQQARSSRGGGQDSMHGLSSMILSLANAGVLPMDTIAGYTQPQSQTQPTAAATATATATSKGSASLSGAAGGRSSNASTATGPDASSSGGSGASGNNKHSGKVVVASAAPSAGGRGLSSTGSGTGTSSAMLRVDVDGDVDNTLLDLALTSKHGSTSTGVVGGGGGDVALVSSLRRKITELQEANEILAKRAFEFKLRLDSFELKIRRFQVTKVLHFRPSVPAAITIKKVTSTGDLFLCVSSADQQNEEEEYTQPLGSVSIRSVGVSGPLGDVDDVMSAGASGPDTALAGTGGARFVIAFANDNSKQMAFECATPAERNEIVSVVRGMIDVVRTNSND